MSRARKVAGDKDAVFAGSYIKKPRTKKEQEQVGYPGREVRLCKAKSVHAFYKEGLLDMYLNVGCKRKIYIELEPKALCVVAGADDHFSVYINDELESEQPEDAALLVYASVLCKSANRIRNKLVKLCRESKLDSNL